MTKKIVEDIHRFSSVFQSSMGKKYVFNCCICGDSKFKVNAQLRFIEQWITASFFKINIMCCINNKNKKFKKLQEFIDTVKTLNIVEIIYRVIDAGDREDIFEFIIEEINKHKYLGDSKITALFRKVTGAPRYLWNMMKNFKDTVVSYVSGSSDSEDDLVTVSSTVESPVVIESSSNISPLVSSSTGDTSTSVLPQRTTTSDSH